MFFVVVVLFSCARACVCGLAFVSVPGSCVRVCACVCVRVCPRVSACVPVLQSGWFVLIVCAIV